MNTDLIFSWSNAYIWVIFMVIIQYVAMLFFKKGGKRAIDISWYGKKEKIITRANFLLQFLLIGLSFFVPVQYGCSTMFIIGTILYGLSFIGIIAAFYAYGTTPLNVTVRKSVYRFSRNPMYFFYNLSLVGIILITDYSVWILVTTILFIIAIHFVILSEERYCGRTYGTEYLEYTKQTPRYFLFF